MRRGQCGLFLPLLFFTPYLLLPRSRWTGVQGPSGTAPSLCDSHLCLCMAGRSCADIIVGHRLKIEDEGLVKDKLAAWACIRLDRLQHGYRFIDLKDAHGRPSAGKLLVNIEKVFKSY